MKANKVKTPFNFLYLKRILLYLFKIYFLTYIFFISKAVFHVVKPRKAVVREIGEKFAKCISTHPLHNTLNIIKAREQHAKYCNTLKEVGLEVIYVPRDDEHPDSCFVEDNAVIHNGKALICRMAKQSRRGEESSVETVLKQYMPVKRAESPATIEGGDVVHLPDKIVSGLSQRTNYEGIAQMQEWLNTPVSTIFDPSIMHLKSYVTYLGKEIIMATKRFAAHPALEDYKIIIPPGNEEYAADALSIDDVVLMAEGYPEAQKMVKEESFKVISLDVSEIQKCDGALTCLSILF